MAQYPVADGASMQHHLVADADAAAETLLLLLLLSASTAYAQHMLILRSGEKMSGQVVSLADGNISFHFKGNTMKFNVADVAAIQFDEGPGSPPSEMGMKGVSFVLEGRNIEKPPKFENLTMKKGIVSVAITVDKYGNVRKAEPGAEGTTTTDDYLLTLSQKASESTKFNNCPKCPLEMHGTLTFTY